MLKTTGFVLPDVGIYTLAALATKDDPAQVTVEDLDVVAAYLERFYSQGVGKNLASVIFPNCGFAQPAFDKPQFAYKREAWANLVLRGYRPELLEPALAALEKAEYREMVLPGDETAPRCAFSGEAAYLRVSRDMLPMLNGRGVMNFGPMGEAGLPVSAVMLLAIHAMPLGCVVTQGALLAVESDDPRLMTAFVQTNLEKNLRFISLASQNEYDKFPNLSFYKTRLIDVLVEALGRQRAARHDNGHHAPAMNAYHFSNYGTNARITVYALPSSTVQFVWEAGKDQHVAVWQRIVAGSRIEEKGEAEELRQKAPKLTQRSLIYEDLFDLPETAAVFLRTYFLRKPLRRFKQDPRAQYSPFGEADLLSWDLTALFLKRIMNMEKSRIEHIKTLGDRLAAYIHERDDRRLLKALYFERQYWRFRAALLRAMQGYTGSEPLVSFDGFVRIFEENAEFEKPDWNLARDLLMIRIFEQLHRQGNWTTVAETLQAEDGGEALSTPTD